MYDIIIIGAGVIGTNIARELSRYQLKTIVLEKGSDVAVGTSKANSGIVHGGYSEKPGTLKAKYNVEGNRLFDQLAEELEFSFKRCGSLVVCFDQDDVKALEELKVRGEENGVEGLKVLTTEEVRELEPNINEKVYAALYVPSGGIVSPYGMTVALAENAVENGVEFLFNYEVDKVSKEDSGIFKVTSNNPLNPEITGKVLINAAGMYGDDINNMLSENKINIQPRLGEYVLLDTTEENLVKHTLFQLPNKMGKGVLVTPTVDGNIIVGPTSEDIQSKYDVSTTSKGLNHVMNTGALSIKKLPRDKIITSFSGLRAHPSEGDFIIEKVEDVANFINVCGIESPGLSAAPAIAKKVEQFIIELLSPIEDTSFNPNRKAKPVFRKLDNEKRQQLIEENSDFGKIICRCEMVTKAEILTAIHSPLPVTDVDGIKRRTRVGMGRCQGGFCYMKIVEIMATELDIDQTLVTKFGRQSNLLVEKNKASL